MNNITQILVTSSAPPVLRLMPIRTRIDIFILVSYVLGVIGNITALFILNRQSYYLKKRKQIFFLK